MPKQNDFDYSILERTEHRPWPLPDRPWIMTQSWHDLLFAHWPVDRELLRAKVPKTFTLDLFDNQAWVGVIPFHMTNVAPRGLPALPWVSAFPELNVRTYVTVDGKPGVYFFSLDAGNPIAVGTARSLFHLPYFSAAMTVNETDGSVDYSSRRTSKKAPAAEFAGRYRATGPVHEPARGTIEDFLTERYCLYTVDGHFRPYRCQIHHRPWPLQPADLELSVNTMADAAGIRLPAMRPLLHFAKRLDMVCWNLERLGPGT
jgi:uncharacterized protein YqjF (DUF2071 family)